MKNLKILIIFTLIISIINACGPEPMDTCFKIKNVSNHDVKLSFFNMYIDSYVPKDTSFFIGINSEIDFHPPFSGIEDSAYVIFDDVKQLIYKRDDGKARNILDLNSYDREIIDGCVYNKYLIKDEDYDNAEEIE